MNKSEQGKKNRKAGALFEKIVREDLEKKEWVVARWTKQVEDGKLINAKSNRFNMRTCGFPDFIAYKLSPVKIIGIECKSNGCLSPEEKAKITFLNQNQIFHKILIARKGKVEKEEPKIVYETAI